MPGIQYPAVNGTRFDFSSIEFTVAGVLFNGVAEINYDDSLKPGEVRGTHAQMIGRTRGKYEAKGDISFFKSEHQQLITLLSTSGLGYMETAFDILVTYSENGFDTIQDKLVGCRLTSGADSNKEGGDPTVVKCELSVMYILRNGATPLNPKQMLK